MARGHPESQLPSCSKLLKLSPSEAEYLVQEERKKWRIFRLQQVRQQASEHAARIREAVSTERQRQASVIKSRLREKWEDDKKQKLEELYEEYDKCMARFGEAQRNAALEATPERVLAERQKVNETIALKRGRNALRDLQQQKQQKEECEQKFIKAREVALHKEKQRAHRVARLPLPPETVNIKPQTQPKKTVVLHEAGTFTTTRYVPDSVTVEKEKPADQADARVAAKEEAAQLCKEQARKNKETCEYQKKIEDRGMAALRKEKVRHMYQDLLAELSRAEKEHELSAFLRAPRELIDCGEWKRVQERAELETERILVSQVESHTEAESEDSSDLKGYSLPTICSFEEMDPVDRLRELIQQAQEQICINSRKSEPFQDYDLMKVEGFKRPRFLLSSNLQGKPPLTAVTKQYVSKESLHFGKDNSEKDKLSLMDSIGTTEESSHSDREVTVTSTMASCSSSESYTTYSENLCGRRILDGEGPPSQKQDDIHAASTVPAGDWKCLDRAIELKHHPEVINSSLEWQQSGTQSSMSSFDAIRLRLKVKDTNSAVPSPETVSKSGSESETGGDSRSTEYLQLPSHIPSLNAGERDALMDRVKLSEQRIREVQKLVDALNKGTSSGSEKFKSFSTPPRVYRKEISGDGSGKRPLKRKVKFEHLKRKIVEHYVKQIIELDKSSLQVPASSVDGSGLTVSPSCLMEEIGKDIFGKQRSLETSINSPNFSDIDTVPVRLSDISRTASEIESEMQSSSNSAPSHHLHPLCNLNATSPASACSSTSHMKENLSPLSQESISNKAPVDCSVLWNGPAELCHLSKDANSAVYSTQHAHLKQKAIQMRLQELQQLKELLMKQCSMHKPDRHLSIRTAH